MIQSEKIKTYCMRLRLTYIHQRLNDIILQAQQDKPTYLEFLEQTLKTEADAREYNGYITRLKSAKLPQRHDLDEYDFGFSSGISERQLRELRELTWLQQAYNIILMGPSGTGKTYIASGLIYDAIKAGKKAYLFSMEEIITCLKTKDISPSAMTTYNKIIRADLLAIDDIMLFPVKGEEATAFFNLINTLHEKTSIIITTNKAPTEWVKTLNDEVLTSALLDRLLYRCEIVKLSGKSYRMENRRTIFDTQEAKKKPGRPRKQIETSILLISFFKQLPVCC